jgi:hypothetical protein
VEIKGILPWSDPVISQRVILYLWLGHRPQLEASRRATLKKCTLNTILNLPLPPPPQIHFRSETYIALFPPVCLESVWGVKVYRHWFLNSVLDGDVWKLHVFTPSPFGTNRTESWLGPKTAIGYFQNSKTTPVGNRTRNSRLYSSWCSHCNDWAISITKFISTINKVLCILTCRHYM